MRPSHIRLLTMLILLGCASPLLAEPQRISLWNNHAPIDDTQFEEADAWITVHRADKGNGTTVVICPGGGYRGLVTGGEGHGIAQWLNSHGITGVVLEYRLPAGRPYVPLLDAQRAIRTVRAQRKGLGRRSQTSRHHGFLGGRTSCVDRGNTFRSGR